MPEVIPGFLAQTPASAWCRTETMKPSTGQQVWEGGVRAPFWELLGRNIFRKVKCPLYISFCQRSHFTRPEAQNYP